MPLAKEYSAIKYEGKMDANEKLIYQIIKTNKSIDASSILPTYNQEMEAKLTIHQLWEIIKTMVEKKMLRKTEFDLTYFSDITHGFVGADLQALTKEAAMKALRRYLPEIEKVGEDESIPVEILETLKINKNDFIDALKDVQPSGLREFTSEIPNVYWDDVGALEEVKNELKQAVEWPLKYPNIFIEMGITPPQGIMLFGSPGTGKTLLAKAIATETGANFISVKGPELLIKWVGDSAKGVRKIFRRARQLAPCIVFIDEIDAIASNRNSEQGSKINGEIVNQLLTELDGVESLKDVVFIAATNRPDLIDPSLIRPGRIDKLIWVPAPDEKAREAILKVHMKNLNVANNVSIKELAKKTEGFSGAGLESIIRETALEVLKNNKLKARPITKEDFEEVLKLKKVRSTVDEESENAYGDFKDKLEFRPSYVR